LLGEDPHAGGGPPTKRADHQGGGPAAAARRGTPPLSACSSIEIWRKTREMSTNERKVDFRAVALARLAKFIDKYYFDIDWILIAQACGVIEILDKPTHERVIRAQRFGDPDYPSAASAFLLDVFNTDEQTGILLVNEIISGIGVLPSQEATAELEQILNLISGKEPDRNYLLSSLTIEKLLEVTDIPDDFYRKLIDEINYLYKHGLALSLSVLIRKLLENLLIDILRKRYGTTELALYYDTSKHRFFDFSILLKNLENRQADFQHITTNLNNEMIGKINSYRETGNSGAHSIDANVKIEFFKDKRNDLNYLVQFLFRLLKNISP